MSYITYLDRLIEILTPFLTAKKIKQLFDYEPELLAGFPIVSVVAASNEEAFHSTANNTNVYNFSILLFDDLSSKTDTKSEVERRILTLADELLELLRKSTFTDGYLQIATAGGMKYLARESGNVRAFEVKFQIVKKLPRE